MNQQHYEPEVAEINEVRLEIEAALDAAYPKQSSGGSSE